MVYVLKCATLEAGNTCNMSYNNTIIGKNMNRRRRKWDVLFLTAAMGKAMLISSAPDCCRLQHKQQQQPTGGCRRVSRPVEKQLQVLIVKQ